MKWHDGLGGHPEHWVQRVLVDAPLSSQWPVVSSGCEAASAAAVREAAAGGHLLAAASWYSLGRPDLAAGAAATVVACYAGGAPADATPPEGALAHAQLAVIAYERRGYKCAAAAPFLNRCANSLLLHPVHLHRT